MKPSFVAYLNIFCLIVLLVGSSCKKDKLQHTTVSGMVIDATTQKAISGASVKLITQKRQFLGYGGYNLVDSLRSDTEGKFYFSFHADDDFTYYLKASSKGYIDQGTLTGLTNGKKNNTNLPLQPEAFLRINIVNEPPIDKVQELWVDAFIGYPQPPPLINSYSNYSIKGKVWGNYETKVIARTIKNGVTNQMNYTVYCPAHDTTTFTIEY